MMKQRIIYDIIVNWHFDKTNEQVCIRFVVFSYNLFYFRGLPSLMCLHFVVFNEILQFVAILFLKFAKTKHKWIKKLSDIIE